MDWSNSGIISFLAAIFMIFANLVFFALWFVKNTSHWKGISEKIIEEELENKKSIIVLIWHNQLMGSTFS